MGLLIGGIFEGRIFEANLICFGMEFVDGLLVERPSLILFSKLLDWNWHSFLNLNSNNTEFFSMDLFKIVSHH